MKKMRLLMGFVSVLGILSGFCGPFDVAELRGVTDRKDPVSYKVGEPISFALSVCGVTNWPSAGNFFVEWVRTGDDGKVETGHERVGEGKTNLTVVTSLDRPGFVHLVARLMDADYRLCRRAGGSAYADIFFDGGAGAETEKLVQAHPEPADFDDFWARQKARLAAVPLRAEKRLSKDYSSETVQTWEVRVDCAGPRPVTGYLSVPVGAAKGTLRTVVGFNGYGATVKGMPVPKRLRTDEIALRINAFGYELGRDKSYYDEFFSSIRTPEYTYAFNPVENADPEMAFFNGMVLRCLRALEFVRTVPEWNGRDLVVEGGSQGGLQVMWCAGLDEHVSEARPAITWCCDLGADAVDRLVPGWRIPYVPALGYYDAVNFAKRVKCPVHITRAGLGDYVCPPSGLAILFNSIPTKKSINWYQGSRHGYVPPNPSVVHADGN